MIRRREEEVAKLMQEMEALKGQLAEEAHLEAKLSHMQKLALKYSPQLFGSQTLGRLIYGGIYGFI